MLGHSPTDTNSRPFVGRTRELGAIGRHLQAPPGERGGVVLIGGEPGVGKSRLLSEAATLAAAQGWRVFIGHAFDTEGMPPYLPFIEALQDYVRECPLETLRLQLGSDPGEIALLLPDVGRRLPGLPSPEALEPESRRYRLFEAIAALLDAMARQTPPGLLLCLEDLQWADDSTLRLLNHLVRRLGTAPILILATYRDMEVEPGTPLAAFLERMARRDGGQRLELKRLSEEEVGVMLAGLGKSDPPPAVVEIVYRETEGNPFFVREVFDYLSQAGRALDSGGAWRTDLEVSDTDVPDGARLVIGRRLESVSAECRRVLGLAAVVGRSFNYELLLAIADLDEAALLDVIDEAVAANLLASAPQTISFSHELIRQTLFSTLSLPRQQALHLRIAGAIEGLYSSDLAPYLADLAGHYRSTTTSAGLDKTADYATRAGDYAASRYAFAEALRLYDVALPILEARGDGHQAALGSTLLKRAEVLVAMARWVEARVSYRAATAFYQGEELAVVLLSLAGASLRPPTMEVDEGRAAAEEARRIAEEVGNAELQAAATALLAECDLDDGSIALALRRYATAYSHGVGTRLPQHMQFLAYTRGLYWAGRIEEAVQRGRITVTGARGLRDSVSDVQSSTDFGLALAAKGLYTEALEAFAHSLAGAALLSGGARASLLARTTGMSCVVPVDLFDNATAESVAIEARRLAQDANFMLPYVSSALDLMAIYSRVGTPERADEMAFEIGELLHHGVGAHGPIWAARFAEAKAEAALARGALADAVVLASAALESARVVGRPKYQALSLTARGTALVRSGRKKDGLADLRRAVDIARPMGNPALLLRSAVALLAFDGDEPIASEASDATDWIVAHLPVDLKTKFENSEQVRLIRRLQDTSVSAMPPRVLYPDGLSEREVDVLRLIVVGRSSREIGDDLVLSVRTVERHIANIYLKTDTHGRAQVTAYALGRGIA